MILEETNLLFRIVWIDCVQIRLQHQALTQTPRYQAHASLYHHALQRRFLDLQVGKSIIGKRKFSCPVRICYTIIPHTGCECKLECSIAKRFKGNDQLSTCNCRRSKDFQVFSSQRFKPICYINFCSEEGPRFSKPISC